MAATIIYRVKRDTAANWTANNTVLLDGQEGLDTTSGKSKYGPGAWNTLKYQGQDELDAKAPKANPSFTGTVSGVTKAHVGLPLVDNTSDASKPVSTLQAAAIALKPDLQTGALAAATDKAAAPTAVINYVAAALAAMVAGAPAQLDTLKEFATALGNDANFSATIMTLLGQKADSAAMTAALAAKLSGKPTYDLAAGTNAMVAATHVNAMGGSNLSTASTFALNSTGCVTGDSLAFLNVGTGDVTVTGAFTNSKTTNVVSQYDLYIAQFYTGIGWVSNTTSQAAAAGVVPLTATAITVPDNARNTAIVTLSRAIYTGGALPAATSFVFTFGTARVSTLLEIIDSTHLRVTFDGAAVTAGQAGTCTFSEGASRIRSEDTDTPLRAFVGRTVTNSVVAASSLAWVTPAARSGSLNLDTATLGGVTLSGFFYLKPPGSLGTVFKAGPLTIAITTSAPSTTPNGGLGVSISSTAQSLTATTTTAQTNAVAAGTPVYYEMAITGFTLNQDYTFEPICGSYGAGATGVMSASLDDGSATTVTTPMAANNLTQDFRLQFKAVAATTLRIRMSSPNPGGAEQMFAGLLMYFLGKL